MGAPATQPTYPAAVKVPTALTTWLARRLTVLMTSGQNSEAPPWCRGEAQCGDAGHGRDRLEEDATARHAAAHDQGLAGGEAAEQRPPRRAGAAIKVAHDVGPGAEQHAAARWLRR